MDQQDQNRFGSSTSSDVSSGDVNRANRQSAESDSVTTPQEARSQGGQRGASQTDKTNTALQSAERDATAAVMEGNDAWRREQDRSAGGATSSEGIKEKARQVVNETMDDAKGQVKSAFADQKARAAERLGGVAGALRQTSEELRSNENDMIAQYTDAAAQQVERFSQYLNEREVGELMSDVRGLARRQPELFVAGALAAGFLLGRFIKSSGQQASNYGQRGSWQNNQWQGNQSQSGQWQGGWQSDRPYTNPAYGSGSTSGGAASSGGAYTSGGAYSSSAERTGASGLSGGFGSSSTQQQRSGAQDIPVTREEES